MRIGTKVKASSFLIVFILLLTITHALIIKTDTQTKFNQGTYINTYYNTTNTAIQLNSTTGTYTSEIFDANHTTSWNTISWRSNAIGKLPNNQQIETRFANGNANMTGNVLLLHMDEINGTIEDCSANNNNGTSYGNLTYRADGKFNTALRFDGNNDYVNCGNDASLNLRYYLTIEAWIKPDTIPPTGQQGSIIDKSDNNADGYWFYLANTGVIGFLRFKGTWSAVGSTSTISAGTWTHLAVTYNNSAANEVNFYIDGQLDRSVSLDGPIDDSSTVDLIIGDKGNLHYFNGTIDEVAVYNKVLSANEILNHYKRGALKLNLTLRSCDDANCNGENFTDLNDDSPQNLNVINNRYFQYKFEFETDDSSYSPELYNVTSDYALLPDTIYPSVFSLVPTANSSFSTLQTIEISANATDEWSIVHVYANITYPNGTNTTLTLNQVGATDKYNASFTTPADIGTYNVTFSANDTSGNINDTETTFFRITDTTPPKVCNVTPVAGTNFSKDSIVYITANVTDNIKVDKVFANITNPDLTIVLLQLYDTDNNSVYKNTIVANQSGIYYVIIIANDTSGNINNTEGTHFDPASVGHRGSGGGAGRMYRDNLAQWEKQYATSETKKDANPKKCIEYWICDEWTECTTNGYQTRICEDYYKCDTIELKPATEQSCEYKKTDAKNEITGATAESSGFTLFLSKKSNIAFLLGILAIIILTTIIGTALFKYKKKKQISKNKKIQKNKEKILSQLKEVYEK